MKRLERAWWSGFRRAVWEKHGHCRNSELKYDLTKWLSFFLCAIKRYIAGKAYCHVQVAAYAPAYISLKLSRGEIDIFSVVLHSFIDSNVVNNSLKKLWLCFQWKGFIFKIIPGFKAWICDQRIFWVDNALKTHPRIQKMIPDCHSMNWIY